MNWIILSSILFGMVHPGSKLILNTGIELIDFCVLYIGIRLIIQIPLYLKNFKLTHKQKKVPWVILIFFGLVGALLQLSEFFGLSKGLSVSTVTFLVYSHPVWSLLLSYFINKEKAGVNEIIRVAIGLVGIYFISVQAINSGIDFDLRIIAPIFAGFMIALWSSLSNRLRKMGLTSIEVSFFYDLFAFGSLVLFLIYNGNIDQHIYHTFKWIQIPYNFLLICFYSVAIGLLPNFLFYLGSGSSSNLNASLLLLIEPIIASITAYLFMSENISSLFIFGAVLIIISGFNFIDYFKLFRNQYSKFIKINFILLIFFLFSLSPINIYANNIYLVELSPQNQSDYTISEELKLINNSSDIALNKIRELFPKCKLDIEKNIKFGSEEELYKYTNSIGSLSNPIAIVGLSRSTFARIGAKSLQNSNTVGISIGASSAKFDEINPNFYSIVSPLVSQVEKIKSESLKFKCNKTLGIFDLKDPLSVDYKDNFFKLYGENGKIVDSLEIEKLKNISESCVFIGINFAKSAKLIFDLSKMKINHIFGTGDWSIHAKELQKTIENITQINTQIHAPTGWLPNLNKNSVDFSKKLKEIYKISANPIGAYTYDSLLVAAETICEKKSIKHIILSGRVKSYLLRNYYGISSSQNLLSDMNMIHFGVENE